MAAVEFDFDSAAKCPQWLAFLDWMASGDGGVIRLLQEWCCYCLLLHLQYQKLLWLVGHGANGKSTFCSVLRQLLGERNVSAVPLERFDSRFGLKPMLGKSLNLVSDVGETDRCAEGVLKQISGGDHVSVDRKYQSTLESVKLQVRLLFSSNSLPYFRDKTNGLWRRLLLVDCKQQLAEGSQVPSYEKLLCQELPGILNWALSVSQSLIQNQRFNVPLSVLASVYAARADLNPIETFLLDHFEAGDGPPISLNALYFQYDSWCNDTGYKKSQINVLAKQLQHTFKVVRDRKAVAPVTSLRSNERHPARRESFYTGIVPITAAPMLSIVEAPVRHTPPADAAPPAEVLPIDPAAIADLERQLAGGTTSA